MQSSRANSEKFLRLAVLQARRLETELDTKLASYAKLCSNFDSGWGSKGESGLATEQVRCTLGSIACTLRQDVLAVACV